MEDPERFGIVEFDRDFAVMSLEEKPRNAKSNYAVTGLYFFPLGVAENARDVKPSLKRSWRLLSSMICI